MPTAMAAMPATSTPVLLDLMIVSPFNGSRQLLVWTPVASRSARLLALCRENNFPSTAAWETPALARKELAGCLFGCRIDFPIHCAENMRAACRFRAGEENSVPHSVFLSRRNGRLTGGTCGGVLFGRPVGR